MMVDTVSGHGRVGTPSPFWSVCMPVPEFSDLLSRHMRRIRASAGGVASEIGISREAVNNWRAGTSRPSRRAGWCSRFTASVTTATATRSEDRHRRAVGQPVVGVVGSRSRGPRSPRANSLNTVSMREHTGEAV